MEILSKPSALIVFLVLTVFFQTLSYAEVNSFTDSNHPIAHSDKNAVCYLDLPKQFEHQLSEGLPNDPAVAKQEALERINNVAIQQQIMQSYQCVIKAWQLGIVKIPAVVVDDQYVVYGVADLNIALELIDKAKRQTN